MQTDELKKVARAASKAALARASMEEAIRDAHTAGESTRSIGTAAGLSHQRIWQMLRGE